MMGRVALGMTVRLKLRRQFNVPSSMSMGEAVERIVAESARRNAMYQRNVRALHRVVEQIESRARDFLTIRERMREAQLAFLQRSCGGNVFQRIGGCVLLRDRKSTRLNSSHRT